MLNVASGVFRVEREIAPIERQGALQSEKMGIKGFLSVSVCIYFNSQQSALVPLYLVGWIYGQGLQRLEK